MITLKIGTRKSTLAMQQANQVAKKLQEYKVNTEIIPIDSLGDVNLTQPIYKLGITGVFTKNLDIALLNHHIDIAVHSLKDIPTQLPEGIAVSAVLARDYENDVLIWKNNKTKELKNTTIGTGSLRRKAFLKTIESSINCINIRGNVQTRIDKLERENLDAIMLSEAGIQRLNLPITYQQTELIPAPGQGVVAITARKEEFQDILQKINHTNTAICTTIERDFLSILEGGCSAPIGALAKVDGENIIFSGMIASLDGKKVIRIHKKLSKKNYTEHGKILAEELLQNGAKEILETIQNTHE